MHPQLQVLADEFHAATERFEALRARVPAERWPVRADPARWSVAECVLHLNLTAEAFVPLLQEAIAQAEGSGHPAPPRYRRDLLGWLLWRSQAPMVRVRTRTAPAFVPREVPPTATVVDRFRVLQAAQLELVARADGQPLDRIRLASPFNPRLRYSAWSALTILPRHQHRHLRQAEQVWA